MMSTYQCPHCTQGLNNKTLGAMGYLRVLVSGWRFWPREEISRVHNTLYMIRGKYPDVTMVVVEGACHRGGADEYAYEWAVANEQNNVLSERHPATFAPNGQLLGPDRNTHMVNLGFDVLLSFPQFEDKRRSGGTWDCTRKALQVPCEFYIQGHEDHEG